MDKPQKMNITFKAPLEHHDSSLGWMFTVYIPEKLIPALGDERNPRVKVTYNDRIESHVSVKSKGPERYLVLNKEVRSKLGLVLGQEVSVRIEEETSKYGMPIPEEFEEVLSQDEEGSRHFHNLTPGNQRSLIYVVSKVKNVDKRINKALAILEHLRETGGEVEYKGLNEKIKEYNQRTKF
jgi:hypothetical protein